MLIKQIKKTSRSEQVFEQLKELILNATWNKGEKIPSENDLAASFGVSRTTIRQAIQKLTVLGLIETRLGEGSFIKDVKSGMYINNIIPLAYLGEDSFNEILEFRGLIEGVVAELATQKITDNEIIKLEEIFKKMEINKDNLELFSNADLEFHLLIAKATKNSILIEVFNIINDVLNATMKKIVTKKGNVSGLYYHKLLLETIKERDHKKVKILMDKHMKDTMSAFTENCAKEK